MCNLGRVIALAMIVFPRALARAETPATPTTRPALNPIAYYQDHCARCHGSYGSGYLPELIGRHSDEELRQIVEEMAVGPAQAPIDDEALAALVAYHRSLIRGEPFVTRTTEASGEVTPGAAVVAGTGDRRTEAVIEGHGWQVEAASGDAQTLVAEKDGRRTVLEPGQRYSHSAPLEPRSGR